MKLTTPIHILKQRAKKLKKTEGIPLHAALEQVAQTQGYNSWSLLQSKAGAESSANALTILNGLKPSDLLLIGARPSLGKTKLALEILLQSVSTNRIGYFFSLEYTRQQTIDKLQELVPQYIHNEKLLKLDFSESISADYIVDTCLPSIKPNSLIVIDYLQLLDQDRNKPGLQTQVKRLKEFAADFDCNVIFISQIDREFDEKAQTTPMIKDVRLPNPLDMSLFDKTIFM